MRSKRYLQPDERSQIVEMYLGRVPVMEIAGRFEVSTHAIAQTVKKAGVRRSVGESSRRYTLNDAFFETRTPKQQFMLLMLVGSKDVCTGFAAFSQAVIGGKSPTVRRAKTNLHEVRINGRRAAALARVLYEDADCALDRKALIAARMWNHVWRVRH